VLEAIRVHGVIRRINVNKDRRCTNQVNRRHCRTCGVGYGNNLISRPHPACTQGNLQGVSPIRYSQRMLGPDIGSKLFFEAFDLRAGEIPSTFQDSSDGLADFRAPYCITCMRARLRYCMRNGSILLLSYM
jgi:hypothetical protein